MLIEGLSLSYCCFGKPVSIKYKYYKCVSIALVIQHAKGMGHVVLTFEACPAL
jgi:hypothetical protein